MGLRRVTGPAVRAAGLRLPPSDTHTTPYCGVLADPSHSTAYAAPTGTR